MQKMTEREREIKQFSIKMLFEYGKEILGQNAGGVISTLMKRKGIEQTFEAIKRSAKAQNPNEYIGGVLKQISNTINDGVEIGTRMGNYVWDGGKWRESLDGAAQETKKG